MNINDIANAANGRKKLPKAEMYSEFVDLVENLDRTDITDGRVYDVLTSMYNFFQPPLPVRPKTPEQWLARSMAGPKDCRYYLQYIYSDGDILVATDGHRLHTHQGTSYPAGFYDKNMQSIKEDAKYPDFKRILPDGRKGNNYLPTFKESLLDNTIKINSTGLEIINVVDDIWVQTQYLKDALSFFSIEEPLELISAGPLDSIAIKCSDYTAVIMPIKAD